MKNKAAFPGQYIQGQGVLNELPGLVQLLGSKGMILASPSVVDKIIPVYGNDAISGHLATERFRGECCEEELERIASVIRDGHFDVIIGMGGGKTIDTAKIAADRACIPVVVVPTIASTDAPCSGCAVVYSRDGIFERVLYQKRNPAVVLVDMNIIAGSPVRFLVSGMGDALATFFEARSCERTQSVNECGGLSTLTGLHLARLCYDTLLRDGENARTACELHIVTPALNHITEANILLSGIGFESSGLAAAHAIHNGLTALPGTHSFFHSEKVAFGVLAGLHLNSDEPEEMEKVYSFCETIGLPTTLSDIGVDHKDRDHLMIAAEKACEPGQSIHHEAGEITSGMVLNAMLMADAYGHIRKSK
jgi:glycerol dehydrogenase